MRRKKAICQDCGIEMNVPEGQADYCYDCCEANDRWPEDKK